ncbi:TetR/AcrR family transcriptional regulator [Arthrobacter tecti]
MTTTLVDVATPAQTVRRRPGRPRNEEIDAQVLQVTLELIDQGAEITTSRVVERSGVSKAALYRRWPSLTTLIAAALDVGREMPPAIPIDGNLRESIIGDSSAGATDPVSAATRRRGSGSASGWRWPTVNCRRPTGSRTYRAIGHR